MVISAINALTLSPALCAVLLRHHTGRSAARSATCWARIDWARDGYAAVVAGWCASPCSASSCSPASLALNALAVQGDPDRLPARRRTRAPSSSRRSCPRAPRSTAPRRWPSGSRSIARRTSRRRRHQHGRRLQHCSTALSKSNSAYFIVAAEAVRGAHRRRRGRRTRSSPRCAPRVPAIREANIIAFNLPPIIGLGTGGGFEYQLLDLQRRRPGRSRRGRARR